MNWIETGQVVPSSLVATRQQLHAGALAIASTAHTVLEHQADDSHANLGLGPEGFSTRRLDAEGRVALHVEAQTFRLRLMSGGEPLAELALEARTLSEVLVWCGREVGAQLGRAVEVEKREFPDFLESPVTQGAAFQRPPQAELDELAAWFANGQALFAHGLDSSRLTSTARVWPHHFDLGALLSVPGREDGTIGVGMSPGDEHYGQPYFYCSPYPAPADDAELPKIEGGHWHTQGFMSAVLTAEELQALPDQAAGATRWLSDAMAACDQLIG